MNVYAYTGSNPVGQVDESGTDFDRWLVTGDWNATDEMYSNALNQLSHSLDHWGDHCLDNNKMFWIGPGGATTGIIAIGGAPLKKPAAWLLPGARESTSVARMLSIGAGERFGSRSLVAKGLSSVAFRYGQVGRSFGGARANWIMLLYIEVGIFVKSGFDTSNDPLEDIPDQ
jgi:hypothetical protein